MVKKSPFLTREKLAKREQDKKNLGSEDFNQLSKWAMDGLGRF